MRKKNLHRPLFRRAASLALALVCLTYLPTLAHATSPAPVRIVVVTGGHDFDESSFFEIFRQMENVEFTSIAYGNGAEQKLTPENMKDVDAIVFYDMHQEKEPQWRGIEQLLSQGKGMLFLHHALWSYDGTWPEYPRILGGRASSKERVVPGPSPTSTYKDDQDVRVHIADPAHPVTRGMQDFSIVDETYNHYWVAPGVHVLLTSENPTSERTIAWSHQYQRSRVVYIQLGHGPSAHKHEAYRTLLRQAIFWVARR